MNYIKIPVGIANAVLADSSVHKYFMIFLYCVLNAAKEDTPFSKKGQLVTTIEKFSRQSGFSTKEFRIFLQKVSDWKLAEVETTSRNTIITILNYDTYVG